MSSMLKKKGGLAFKPKVPAARRAAAPAAAAAAPSILHPSTTIARDQPTTNKSQPKPVASTAVIVTPTSAPEPTPYVSAARPTPTQTRTPQPTTSSTPTRLRSTARTSISALISQDVPDIAPSPALLPTPPPTRPSPRQTRGRRTPAAPVAPAPVEPPWAPVPSVAGQAPQLTPPWTLQDAPVARRTRIAISSLLQSEDAVDNVSNYPALAARAPPPLEPMATRSRRSAPRDTVPPPATASQAPGRDARTATAAITTDGPTPTKRRTTRTSAKASLIGSMETDLAPAQAKTPVKRKYTRKAPSASATGHDGSAAPAPAPAPARPRQSRKRATTADGNERATPTAPKRSRRERDVTPEDAESQTVDHSELKMEDLTKDLRIGKKFSRHDELVDRLREKRRQYRLDRQLGKKKGQDGTAAGATGSQANGGNSEAGQMTAGEAATTRSSGVSMSDAVAAAASVLAAATRRPGDGPVAGPQFEIIDGNIVVNQASLVHDRHAAAAAAAGELEEVEENDFTRQTTSNTYLKPGKLRGPNAWTEAETELFYRALSMFGTSFDLICNWFPGKSRRHIKMKFNREDKLRPDRITQALVGQHKVAIDVDEYISRTGLTLHATETIDAEYAQRQAEHDAEQQRIADDAAELLRKKREALFGPRAGGSGTGAGAGNGPGNGTGNGSGSGSAGAGSADANDPLGGAASAANPTELDENEVDETDLAPTRGRRGGRSRGKVNGMRAAPASGFGI